MVERMAETERHWKYPKLIKKPSVFCLIIFCKVFGALDPFLNVSQDLPCAL